jgi:hypothetical protein
MATSPRSRCAAALALAVVVGAGLQPQPAASAPCASGAMPGETLAAGWERSYSAGCVDQAGKLAAGSEILHLVAHKGRLYAAAGFWMDPRNPWYGGSPSDGKWAQILRLDAPRAGWQVDLEMPQHLRPELLFSATFHFDHNGRPLPAPQTLLFASAYLGNGAGGISLFTRDDAAGRWERSQILPGPTGRRGGDNSVRAMRVHRDTVTGGERLFVSAGVHGVFSGAYDPTAPGKVRWERQSETGVLPVRPLAIVEANGALFFSADKAVWRRVDGAMPRWEVVHDLGDLPAGKTLSPVGGIRGLTPIDNPSGAGQSLILVWAPDGRSRACIMRLDPAPSGFARSEETCLDRLVSRYLDNTPVPFVLAGYNDFLAVGDAPGRVRHLVGFEAWVGGTRLRTVQGKDAKGGYYAGALYAIRDAAGSYRLGEVNGRIDSTNPALEATRAYALSPFAADGGQAVYMGGFDCNFVRCSDTAWIFRADVATVLRATQGPR